MYFNSHCITTWSRREMCRLMPCFISNSQICDRINIRWVAWKLSQISRKNYRVSIAAQRPLIWLQIGEREMKEGIKRHILCIDYVAIRLELQYLTGAQNVVFWGAGYVWKPVATVWNRTGNLDPLLTLHNPMAGEWYLPTFDVSANFQPKNASDNIATISWQ